MSRRRVRAAALVLGVLGAALPVLASLADALLADDVILMTGRRTADEVLAWQSMRDEADPSIARYGHPAPGPPRRLLLLPRSARAALVRVAESPAALLFVDEQQDVHLLAPRALLTPALALGGVALLLGVSLWRRGRSPTETSHRRRLPAHARAGADGRRPPRDRGSAPRPQPS